MLELEAALTRILAAVPQPAAERIALGEAQGRVLAEKVCSPIDLPPFDNSSMDGFAVCSRDLALAGADCPVRLRQAGKVPAGAAFQAEMMAGTCVRLFTGSPLPRGADAVAKQEDTRGASGEPGTVLFLKGAQAGDNIRRRGEDVKCGAALGEPGEVLSAGRLSLLAAAGLARVSVGRRPRVGLLATGSELAQPGQPLGPGQIYESNCLGLAALIRSTGGIPRLSPSVADMPAATREALAEALDQCDVVVTCGGVSVGEKDFVKQAFEQAGGRLEFWRVAIKPGRPFVFGRRGEKLFFGLPGNPVSALVTFLLLARPALLRWQGAVDVSLPSFTGLLAEPLANPVARRHFVRVTFDGTGMVRSAGAQASHMLSSLAAANGLVDVPPQTTLAVGARARVMWWA